MWRSDKKPKFRFDLAINDLSNIPHTSGYCILKVQIADGSLTGLLNGFPLFKSFSLEGIASTEDGRSSRLSGISLQSSKFKIHNFKCHFNLDISCNLRFPLKRKKNMIGNKFLIIHVLYAAENNFKLDHLVRLGMAKVNLAKYLNSNEPVTAKYLLQDSKINSILTLTTTLKELPQDFEFRTELRVNEVKLSQGNNSSLTFSKTLDSNTRVINVPQYQKKMAFGGIEGVRNAQSSLDSKKRDNENENLKSSKSGGLFDSLEEVRNQNLGSLSLENVMVDPIIGNLYRRMLESTWDPDLHSLLKLTPEKVVHDIFIPGDNKGSIEKNLEFYLSLSASYHEARDKTGLLQETKVCDDFKSWSVTWI